MMKNNNNLSCPHCGETFNIDDFYNHNKSTLEDFITNKALNKVETLKQNWLKEKEMEMAIFQQNLEKTFLAKEKEMDKAKANQIANLQNELAIKNEKYKSLKEANDLVLAKKEAEIKNSYLTEISELKKIISENSLIAKAKDENFAQEKQNLISLLKADLAKREVEIKNGYLTEIAELKKVISENSLITKAKDENFAQEKQNLIDRFQIEIAKREEEIKNAFFNEISELKIKNAEIRIINNKTRGENWETEVENELRKAFGYLDTIEKITTGQQKADYLQTVKLGGESIGKIVYEVKNAKWSDSWLPKLSVDVANNKTKYGILVTTSFSEKFHGDISFKQSDEYPNIWISDPLSFIFVAQTIRRIIEIENSYHQLNKKLLKKMDQLSNEEETQKVLEEYKGKIEGLEKYLDFEMPKFLKSFKKQLKDIEGVKNSLLKNVDKLEKTHEMLSRKFNKEVKERLEKISGKKIIELEEDTNIHEYSIIKDSYQIENY